MDITATWRTRKRTFEVKVKFRCVTNVFVATLLNLVNNKHWSNS